MSTPGHLASRGYERQYIYMHGDSWLDLAFLRRVSGKSASAVIADLIRRDRRCLDGTYEKTLQERQTRRPQAPATSCTTRQSLPQPQ